MPLSMPLERIGREIEQFIPRTGLRDGMIYLQATRGVSPRNHVFPASPKPTLLFYSKPLPPAPDPGQSVGIRLLAVNDERWKRCWIKTVGLIGHILAKNEAMDRGFDEAAFVDDGLVSECSTSNFFIVKGARLITHPADARILAGITRGVVLQCAEALGVQVEQRPPGVEEIAQADEVFITSTTKELAWVSHWGEQPVGQGRAGELTLRLHRAFQERVQAETGTIPAAQSAA